MEINVKDMDGIVVCNRRGQKFHTKQYAYYNMITPNLQIQTLKVIINCFVFFNKSIFISYVYKDLTKLININNVYDTEEEAMEVASGWIHKMITQELDKEIKLSLANQENVPLSIQELNQS